VWFIFSCISFCSKHVVVCLVEHHCPSDQEAAQVEEDAVFDAELFASVVAEKLKNLGSGKYVVSLEHLAHH